jgi:hypothetical protein
VKKVSNVPELSALRKWCGELKNGKWCFQPLFLKPDAPPRPAEEIAALVDKRPLDELADQVEQSVQQILCRAYSGDVAALHKFARIVCGAVEALGRLAQFRDAATKTMAETFSMWPVLLSLNPQEIQRAKDELLRLGVGTKAPAPTRPGQHLDPHNFWTRLATKAFEVCRSNRCVVPILQAHIVGARKRRRARMFWKSEVKATICARSDGSIVIIPDWLKHCGELAEPVTTTNFSDWWKVIKLCVLDYWKMYPREYAEALKRIPDKQKKAAPQTGNPPDENYRLPKEHRKRTLALARVKQAFKGRVTCNS